MKEGGNMLKLYVGHLAFHTNEVNLRSAFEEAGVVVHCDLIRNNFNGSPLGFAYVEMRSEAEAAKAVQRLNGKELDGSRLYVARLWNKIGRDSTEVAQETEHPAFPGCRIPYPRRILSTKVLSRRIKHAARYYARIHNVNSTV